MPKVLLVLTEESEGFAELFQQTPGSIETLDLRDGDPDYNVLLDKIFEADSVQIW